MRAITVVDCGAPVLLVATTWAVRDHGLYRTLVHEDGVYEWLGAGCLAAAAIVLATAARRAVGHLRLAMWICVVGIVGVVGEELAWGSRLFGFDVELVESHNVQGDATLHNLPGGLELSFLGMTLASTALAVLLVSTRIRVPRAGTAGLLVWLFVPAAYSVLRFAGPDAGYAFAKLSEAVELVFSAALLRVALAVRRLPPQGLT
jgi:hypothetical protein